MECVHKQSMVQVKYETVNNTCELGSQQVEAVNEFQNPSCVWKKKSERNTDSMGV